MIRPAMMACALALAAGPVFAQEIDPSAGRAIALDTCSRCHRVDANPDGPSPVPEAPRFADVARMRSATPLSIGVFLRTTHPSMPNFHFSQSEVDSITSYILGLAKQ